jgi:FMN reductase
MMSTPETVKIVGLGGSLRPDSTSLAALRVALAAAEEAGAVTELYDLATLDLPMYDPRLTDAPNVAHRLAEATCEADGMLWSSPLYHGTVSGAFKNAIDWLHLLADQDPPYLSDKVIGLISTAGGVHGLQAVNTMEFAVRSLRGWAVPLVVTIPRAWQLINDQGQIEDPLTLQNLTLLGREVVRAAQQFDTTGTCDYAA